MDSLIRTTTTTTTTDLQKSDILSKSRILPMNPEKKKSNELIKKKIKGRPEGSHSRKDQEPHYKEMRYHQKMGQYPIS
jgi:hypothetical protein